jgi:hypothetical protein
MFVSSCALIAGLTSCGGKNTQPNVTSPGDEKDAKSKVLEAGADVIQDKTPLSAVNIYLNGFHFYNGDINGQMEAHHYAIKINEDVHQALIFDANTANAKLMGVEYIISERLFRQLPEEEKKLWHSHVHEVKSGTLIAAGLPLIAEHELMEKLVSTYGKTIHTWHTDRDLELPYGIPQIMMGFTKDGQLKQELVNERDKRFRVSTVDKRKNRNDIPAPPVVPGADAWQTGQVRQLTTSTQVSKNSHESH